MRLLRTGEMRDTGGHSGSQSLIIIWEKFCNKASRLQTAKTAINAKSTSSLLVPNALFNELIVAAMQRANRDFSKCFCKR